MRRLGHLLVGFCLAAAVVLIPQPAIAADVVITNPPPSPVTPHVPFSHQFIATGGIAPYTFTLGTPPLSLTNGLSLSPGGLLSGTPDTPGTWIFTVLVTDAFDTVAALNVTMVVNAPIITMTPPLSPIPALVDFSHTFPSGGKAPYTLTHVGTLPTGMALDSPGVLVGIPQQTGTFTFTVRATDAQGFKSGDLAVTLVVVPPTIVVGPAPASPIYTGQAFTHTFSAAGALGTKSFALEAGSLPPGLTLTSAGVLAGTPTTAATYPFTIRATTTFGPLSFSGDQAFAIVVAVPDTGFTSPAPPGGVVGTPYSFSFTAAGDAGITFGLTGGALPPGLVLAADGLLSGTPTTAGTYTFVVKATGSGSSAEQNATVTIVRSSTPSPSAPPGQPGQPGQPGSTMPATGVNIVAYGVSGGLMVLAGLVLLSVARRRARR